jgi:hypothetical protein
MAEVTCEEQGVVEKFGSLRLDFLVKTDIESV